jgi:hypothetical protein
VCRAGAASRSADQRQRDRADGPLRAASPEQPDQHLLGSPHHRQRQQVLEMKKPDIDNSSTPGSFTSSTPVSVAKMMAVT